MKIKGAVATQTGIIFSNGQKIYESRLTRKGLSITRASKYKMSSNQETCLGEIILFAASPTISIILGLILKINFNTILLVETILFIVIAVLAFHLLLRRRLSNLTYQFHTIEHKLCNILDKKSSDLALSSLKDSDWFSDQCGSLYSIRKFYFVIIYAVCVIFVFPYILVFPKNQLCLTILPTLYNVVILLLGIIIKKISNKILLKQPVYRLTRLLQKRYHKEPTEEQYAFGLALGQYLISTEQTR